MNRSRYLAVALSCAMMALPAAAAKKPAVKKALSVAMPEDSAVAFDKSESIILTMGRALNIALENNLTVLQARQGVESARGKSKAAHSALGPMLKATGALDAYDNVPNTPDNSAAARVDLTQSVYSGGKNQALAKQAQLGVKNARHSLESTRESVVLVVWNAYCEMLYRREVLRSTRDALAYYTNAEKELRERVTYGLSTNLDLTRVRQQKENARAANIAAGNNLEAARIELCRLLRFPPETNLALTGTLEDGLPSLEEAKAVPVDKKAFFVEVLKKRNDYQSLKMAEEIQKKELTVAKSGHLPSVSLSTGYRFSYSQNGSSVLNDNNQWTATLSMSVPLYDGGLTSGNIRTARAGLKSAEHAVTEKEEKIKAELVDNWLTLQNALETVKAGRTNLELARLSLSYAESGYREGVNTQIDLLQARSELTSSLQQLAQYLRDCRQAQAAYWQAQGILIDRALFQEQKRDAANGVKKAVKK